MFRSKARNLICPQFEHSRLAGLLAWHWGNVDFDRPALDFTSFARGVTLHDWHYGLLDNHPLGAYGHAEWLAIAERGVAIDYADDVTDVVAKRHLRRLIGEPADAETQTLVERLETKIEHRTEKSPYPPDAFEWADRITRFCDTVAFDFGFENRGPRTASVYRRRDDTRDTEIGYEITPDGMIRFDPWPFDRDTFGMPVTVFEAVGYPDQPEPIVAFVRCVPARGPIAAG